MANIALHRLATRQALSALLADPARDPRLARRLGLGEAAARALCGWHQPLHTALPALVLGFAPGLPAAALPRMLRSALDGREPLPVRCAFATTPPLAQAWASTRNAQNDFLPGALGGVLRSDANPARLFGLTAGHVWGGSMNARIGDTVGIAPEDAMLPALTGRLLGWRPNFVAADPASDIDAAVAELDAAALASVLARPALWPTGSALIGADDQLRLLVRDREITGWPVALADVPLSLDGGLLRNYRLTEALCWRPDEPTQGGDSGGPVWNGADALVAIHAGAGIDDDGAPLAYAVPIQRVLRWAGASVVRRGESLAPPAPPPRAASPQPLVTLGTPPPAAPDTALDLLARTLWGEARGEGRAGMEAVAHVVYNRIAARSWWGRDVAAVCRKPWQFSCWNANDPNRGRLLQLNAGDTDFRIACLAARAVADAEATGQRGASDPTQGATHYYAPDRVAAPRWALGRAPCARLGRHLFFKGVA